MEHAPTWLTYGLMYLSAAVLAVPLAKALGLGSIIGYLAAGIAIGPWGLGLVSNVPFWGQFWGQICETDSDSQRSNKCAALVSLRNMNTSSTGFLPVKSPTNPYISFTL